MTSFRYKGKSGPGRVVEGVLEAENRLAALGQLSRQGYFPLFLEERSGAESIPRRPWGRRVSSQDVCLLARQLADLLESGVPLLRALILVQDQTGSATLARIVREIVDQVRGGQPLSKALKDYPAIFSPLIVSLIYAGEVGGTLHITLERLADFLEQEGDFKSRVRAALVYPCLIALVGLGTVVFLMSFAVPRLADMFSDMGQSLPLVTRLLIGLSAAITSYGGWMAAPALAGGALWLFYAPPGKRPGRILRRIPIWGPVVQKSAIARFARTLATLLAGGVPIVQALRVVSDVLDNQAFKSGILEVSRQVEQGRSLSECLHEVPGLPAFICQMVAVGEEVNALERSLNKVASAYERETDRAMKLAATLLEPAMILLIGSVVGAVVIAMLLPIFQISAFVK